MGGKLLDISLGNGFLDLTPKAKAAKAKTNKWEDIKTEKLLYSPGSHQQSENSTYGMGEDICKSY